MNTTTKLAIASLALTTLAACGGSETGNTAFQNKGQDLLAASQRAEAMSLIQSSSLPTSGTANYSGGMLLVLDEDTPIEYGMIGDMNLNVNYGANTVSGNANNFIGEDDLRIGGNLAMSSGSIDKSDPSGAVFLSDLDGTLSIGNENLTVDAELAGTFGGSSIFDSSPNAAIGIVSGTTVSNLNGSGIVDGIFVVE